MSEVQVSSAIDVVRRCVRRAAGAPEGAEVGVEGAFGEVRGQIRFHGKVLEMMNIRFMKTTEL